MLVVKPTPSWCVQRFCDITSSMITTLLVSLLPIGAPQIAVEDAIESATAVAEAAQDKAQSERPQAPAPPPIEIAPAEPTESREDYFNRQPYPEPGSMPWIGIRDYPDESWAAGEEGEVGYTLTTSQTGAVTACEITYPSGIERLDTLTCDLLMTRAKLTPGVGPDGETVAGTYASFMNWTKREPRLQGDYTIAVRFELDDNGEEANCEVLEVSGELPPQIKKNFERDPCPSNMAGEAGVPYRDENGAPIGKAITVRVEVSVEDLP